MRYVRVYEDKGMRDDATRRWLMRLCVCPRGPPSSPSMIIILKCAPHATALRTIITQRYSVPPLHNPPAADFKTTFSPQCNKS